MLKTKRILLFLLLLMINPSLDRKINQELRGCRRYTEKYYIAYTTNSSILITTLDIEKEYAKAIVRVASGAHSDVCTVNETDSEDLAKMASNSTTCVGPHDNHDNWGGFYHYHHISHNQQGNYPAHIFYGEPIYS